MFADVDHLTAAWKATGSPRDQHTGDLKGTDIEDVIIGNAIKCFGHVQLDNDSGSTFVTRRSERMKEVKLIREARGQFDESVLALAKDAVAGTIFMQL